MRYDRNEALTILGKNGQILLSKQTVCIVGLGAIGSVAGSLLARSGVHLILIDSDNVEESNLQRQILYSNKDIGKNKAEVSKEKLAEINPEINITSISDRLVKKNSNYLESDLVLDCTDNLGSRNVINNYCLDKIPWVHAAAVETNGVVFNVLPKGPCFNCVYKFDNEMETCEELGVLSTITTSIASMQVTQAFKILLDKNPESKLLRYNIWDNEFDKIVVNKDSKCKSCNYYKKATFSIKLCKSKATYSVKPIGKIKLNLNKIKDKFDTKVVTPILLVLNEKGEEIIVHQYGEIIFKKLKDEVKIRVISMNIYNVGI